MNITLDEFLKKLNPKFPNERAFLQSLWTAQPEISEAGVQRIRRGDYFWRVPVETFRGVEFCRECQGIAPMEQCRVCGLDLPARTLTLLDCMEPMPTHQQALRIAGAKILEHNVAAQTALMILRSMNHAFGLRGIAAMRDSDVDEIFVHVGAEEAERRSGKGA